MRNHLVVEAAKRFPSLRAGLRLFQLLTCGSTLGVKRRPCPPPSRPMGDSVSLASYAIFCRGGRIAGRFRQLVRSANPGSECDYQLHQRSVAPSQVLRRGRWHLLCDRAWASRRDRDRTQPRGLPRPARRSRRGVGPRPRLAPALRSAAGKRSAVKALVTFGEVVRTGSARRPGAARRGPARLVAPAGVTADQEDISNELNLETFQRSVDTRPLLSRGAPPALA